MLLLLMVYPMVSFGVLFHSTCKIVFLTSALFKISEIKLNYNEIFIKSNILMWYLTYLSFLSLIKKFQAKYVCNLDTWSR